MKHQVCKNYQNVTMIDLVRWDATGRSQECVGRSTDIINKKAIFRYADNKSGLVRWISPRNAHRKLD